MNETVQKTNKRVCVLFWILGLGLGLGMVLISASHEDIEIFFGCIHLSSSER